MSDSGFAADWPANVEAVKPAAPPPITIKS